MTGKHAEEQLEKLARYVTDHLGLEFTGSRLTDLSRGAAAAGRENGFSDLHEFIDYVLGATPSPLLLQNLASHLTVGETYFFREKMVFELLEGELLPGMLESAQKRKVPLRIWSAACCTGEEAYSLAIVVHRLLRSRPGCKVQITGTDINPHFLEKAVTGIYSQWSFRATPAHLKDKYFHELKNGMWEVDLKIRSMVDFELVNLANLTSPGTKSKLSAKADLIICRNVLMYFSPLQAEKTLQNLQDRLALEGYLILGPNEGSSAAAADFSTSIHKGARIYRKNGVVPTPKSFRQITAPGDATLPSAPLAPAEVQRRAVLPESVVLPDLPQKPGLKTETLASRVTGLMEESRRLADEGNLEQALAQCDEVLKLDRLNSTAFYFRAIILQEKNEPGEARASLQRAIYLDPNFVLAHFALGNLARTMAKPKEAQKHFDNALTLAEKLPLDQILAESEGLAVSRLIEMIRILKLNFSD